MKKEKTGLTPAELGERAARQDAYDLEEKIGELRDEDVPQYAIQPFTTALLMKIARGDIDMKKLAREELENRGLDPKTGAWVGFKKAALRKMKQGS